MSVPDPAFSHFSPCKRARKKSTPSRPAQWRFIRKSWSLRHLMRVELKVRLKLNFWKFLTIHHKVIPSKIEEVKLPEDVDMIISEPMGYMLYNERMLETYIHARKVISFWKKSIVLKCQFHSSWSQRGSCSHPLATCTLRPSPTRRFTWSNSKRQTSGINNHSTVSICPHCVTMQWASISSSPLSTHLVWLESLENYK